METIGSDCFGPVTDITQGALYGVYPCGITKITFEEGSRLKKIDGGAFSCCRNLKEIEIPASVEDLNAASFACGTESLIGQDRCEDGAWEEEACEEQFNCDIDNFRISPGNKVYEVVGESMFMRVGSNTLIGCFRVISEIEIPANIEEIGDCAFQWCYSLSRVTFASGSTLKRIGNGAFRECINLEEISEIPSSVVEIGDACFSLEKISTTGEEGGLCCITFVSGSGLKRIENGAFRGCGKLEDIEIPTSVEEIGEMCFYECSSLSRVTFGSGSVLKRIGKEAFRGCKELREIQLPASVEEIGEKCFENVRVECS